MVFPHRSGTVEARGALQPCAVGVGPGTVLCVYCTQRDVEAKSGQTA